MIFMLTSYGIKYVRLALGISLEELATKTYLTRQSIWRMELGKSNQTSTKYLLSKILMEEFEKINTDDNSLDFRLKCAERGIKFK